MDEREQRSTWGADELNFAEFPLALISGQPSDQKTISFQDDIVDESTGRRVHRKLTVSGNDAYGLPTPRDSDVLLVLIAITKQKNGFSDRAVKFQRSELLRILGWDDGGTSYQRLNESLQRWASVTLFYNGAWWDRLGKRWQSRTFHVLERLDLRGRETNQGEAMDDGLSSFTWNEDVFSSFQARNMKELDLDTYFKLTRPASRQAYRFLDKRFWHSPRLVLDFRTFCCEHIGFSKGYDNGQLKRKAQPMLGELESVGFLKPMPIAERVTKKSRGKWNILLISEGKEPLTAKDGSKSSVEQALIEKGVRPAVAKQLATQHAADAIWEKIQLYNWLLAHKDARMSKSPAGFLVKSIRENYRPEDFLAQQKKTPAPPRKPRVPRATASDRDNLRRAQILDRWNQLSQEQQVEVEAAALVLAKPLIRDTYDRLKDTGGVLFEQVRLELVAQYWRCLPSQVVVHPDSRRSR